MFELQFMPGLIGNLKLANQTYSTKDLNSQNDDHNTETGQFADSNNKYNLGSLRNTTHDENEGILTVDLGLREDQRKTFLAAVNQVHDVTIEFGTVMVFTCSKSCWSEKESVGEAVYLEEFCLVEADPDALLFK